MLFEEIVGNQPIKAYLKNILKKKAVPNSLLFSGPEGIGKSLFAKALALSLMYPEEADEKEAKRIDNLTHPDFHFFQPEGKISMHNITSIRKLIELSNLSPFEARAKVFVIDEADRMLATSANALLKTLEEPNLDCYIILLTSKEEELLPTILSRVVCLKFMSIEEKEMVHFLKRWGKTQIEAQRIALLSHGSIERAAEISSFVDTEENTKLLIDLLSKKGLISYLEMSQILDKIVKFFKLPEEQNLKKHKETELFLSHILMWYKDLHQLNIAPQSRLFFADHLELLQKEALKPLPSLDEVHSLLEEVKLALERNIKLRTALEHLFLQLDIV